MLLEAGQGRFAGEQAPVNKALIKVVVHHQRQVRPAGNMISRHKLITQSCTMSRITRQPVAAVNMSKSCARSKRKRRRHFSKDTFDTALQAVAVDMSA